MDLFIIGVVAGVAITGVGIGFCIGVYVLHQMEQMAQVQDELDREDYYGG